MRKSKKRSSKPSFHHRSQGGGKPKSSAPQTSLSRPRENSSTEFVEGIIQVKGRSGFVLSLDAALADVLVQGTTLRLAANGDRVRVKLLPVAAGARRLGIIVSVIEHRRSTAVGIFNIQGKRPVLIPESGDEPVRILDMKGHHPNAGDLVVVHLTEHATVEASAGGVLTEVLGARRTPSVDLKALIYSHELPQAFPAAAEEEAVRYGAEVPEQAYAHRETFFHLPVFTIDGADAKDFDDAVSIEPIDGGWRLGVHIADVAHYVKEGDALDAEAVKRGTSVYLTGHVIPMLPFPLSDGLCSLRPDCIRLTLSCVMDIDARGRVVKHGIVESAIRSAKRFTYEEIDHILDGKAADVSSDILRDVKRMGGLARQLRDARFARGSLDFDFPEPYFVLDREGWPLDIRRRSRTESHRLIEEFMLLANETVATHMKDVPFLYRIHETPSPEKLTALEKTLNAIGVPIPKGLHGGEPKALQQIIHFVEGKPIQTMVQMLLLRSLKQAIYSPRNAGHYGLASQCYTHFTSPIRRYPDLLVHRIIKERLGGHLTTERQAHWKKILTNLCEESSRRERAAVEAEREFVDLKKAQLMKEHVGESFDGVISSVTAFGIFVQFAREFIEGLVHISNMPGDYYVYDEVRMVLRGRRNGRTFQIGQPVRVTLVQVNLQKHQMDLELVEPASNSKQSKR